MLWAVRLNGAVAAAGFKRPYTKGYGGPLNQELRSTESLWLEFMLYRHNMTAVLLVLRGSEGSK